jgi:uncharacterized protein
MTEPDGGIDFMDAGNVELFIIPESEDDFIVYAPLACAAARVNATAATAVEKFISGEDLEEDEKGVISDLEEYGLFEREFFIHDEKQAFAPVETTLFLTSACNLNCVYCYANGGDEPLEMPHEVAEAAIDIVAKNAAEKNEEAFVLAFHGNGEPFAAFERMKECVRYATRKAEKYGVDANITAATNGVLTDEMVDFVLAYFSSINCSFDVLPPLQNKYRPFRDGSPSYDAVFKTLKRLDNARFSYGIRVTLTGENAKYIEDIAGFILSELPNCDVLHIEPAWESGRCLSSGEKTPDAEEFTGHFLKAMDLCGDRLRMALSSAKRESVSNMFCGAASGSFTVTPEGYVTSCYEVFRARDPRSSRYFIGRYCPEEKTFRFDHEKIDALWALRVENMPWCKNCFCKWHCAGDCPAKLLQNSAPERHEGSMRCHITKSVTLRQIQEFLEQRSEDYEEQSDHEEQLSEETEAVR